MCNFKRNFLKCCVPWLRHEPLGAMTAVSYCKLIPRVPGANISEVPNSAEEFAHSAGGPQLELGWGPGRAKRARARPKKKKVKKNFFYMTGQPALASALFYCQKKKSEARFARRVETSLRLVTLSEVDSAKHPFGHSGTEGNTPLLIYQSKKKKST